MSDNGLLKQPLPYWKWFLFNCLFFLLAGAGDLASDVLRGCELPKWWVVLIFLGVDILLSLLFAYFDMLLFNPQKESNHKSAIDETQPDNKYNNQ